MDNHIIVKGKITKRTYCPSCFSIITWDSSSVEKNGMTKCPACGGAINCSKAEVLFSDVIEDKDIAMVVNGVAYKADQLEEALVSLGENGGYCKLNSDLALTKPISFKEGQATIDIDNHILDCGNNAINVNAGTTLIIEGKQEGKITGSGDHIIRIDNGSSLIMNSGKIEAAKWGIDVVNKSKATINGGEIQAREACLVPSSYSSVIINDGELSSKDNFVIGVSGAKEESQKTKFITINGGTIISKKPITVGYISCGIYSPSATKIVLNGGKIISEDGCGILMRAGNVECNGTIIEAKGNSEGWVGDSKQVIKADGIAYDSKANYPDKDTLKLTINKNAKITSETAQRIGTYLAEGDTANIIDKTKADE